MPRPRRSPLVAAIALAALVPAGVASAVIAPTKPPVPTLTWTACPSPAPPDGDGLAWECTTMPAPLDYGAPGGPTIGVSVVRLPATDPAHRIGSLLVNPGGPGASGVEFARDAADLFATLNTRFDIVGWDPRGTVGTIPVTCLDDATLDASYAASPAFPTLADRGGLIADGRAFTRACRENTGDTIRYISTENTARDMDLLRAALGDSRLSYLGFSYGTYLGATYAQLFPSHVRALVLDGAVDAQQYATDPIGSGESQMRAFQVALTRFFSYCVLECEFGDGSPEAAYRRLLTQADATPLPTLQTPGGRPVRAFDVINATILPLYSRQLWPLLGEALTQAEAGDGTLLRILADAALGRDEEGHYSQDVAAFPAILSLDTAWPTDLSRYDRLLGRWTSISPYFGPNFWAANYLSAVWDNRANDRYLGPFRAAGAAPILVVGTTYDPATPYAEAVSLTKQLRSARLLTMRGDGHTAYGGNSNCIDIRVNRYLLDLRLPAQGTVCTQQLTAPPVSGGSGASVRAVIATHGNSLRTFVRR